MSTRHWQTQLKQDAGSIARLSNWAGATGYTGGQPASGGISYQMSLAGFVQQNDTGQAIWVPSSGSISGATGSGTTGSAITFHYTLLTGPALRVGMPIGVTGCTTLAFNNLSGYTVGSISGTGAAGSSFTVLNQGGQTGATGSEVETGTFSMTASALPSTQATVTNGLYEIWKSNDSQTPYIVKLEYGQCAANIGGVAVTLGTSSSGAGAVSGNVGTRQFLGAVGASSQGDSTYECNFYGDLVGGNFAAMMWRNDPATTNALFFCFERSKDSTGTDTSTYVTLLSAYGATTNAFQESLFLSGGISASSRISNGWAMLNSPASPSSSWIASGDGNVPVSPVYPIAKEVGNPLSVVVCCMAADCSEGTPFVCTIYGASHTYLPTKVAWATYVGNAHLAALAIRADDLL